MISAPAKRHWQCQICLERAKSNHWQFKVRINLDMQEKDRTGLACIWTCAKFCWIWQQHHGKLKMMDGLPPTLPLPTHTDTHKLASFLLLLLLLLLVVVFRTVVINTKTKSQMLWDFTLFSLPFLLLLVELTSQWEQASGWVVSDIRIRHSVCVFLRIATKLMSPTGTLNGHLFFPPWTTKKFKDATSKSLL